MTYTHRIHRAGDVKMRGVRAAGQLLEQLVHLGSLRPALLMRAEARSIMLGLIVLAAFAAASSCDAQSPQYMTYYDGDTLYAECTGEPDARNRCLGYVTGVADVLAAAVVRGDVTIACLPPEVAGDQARDVVVNFLRDNPQSRRYPAASQVELALSNAFPCRW